MSDIVLFGHRGGGDPYPDSTRESYLWGINWGADFVEPDLYLTKDGVLVVSHDNISGGFASINYADALAQNPALMTFDQLIDLVKEKSVETGRDIGIIPETKSTDYATSEAVVKAFVDHGFTNPNLIYIQSFSATNLQWLHDTIMPKYGVNLQLLQLSSGISNPTQIATYADVIAPSIGSFSAADVEAAHAAGLKVIAWTITGAQSDIQNLINMNVDGVFVDNMQQARPGEENIEGIKVAYGTPQWDVVSGTAGADMVYAMQGDDIVRAGDGNDVIYGDGGNDVLFGGTGNDQLVGGGSSDFLAGGAGTNVLDGSAGNDVIVATGDNDQVLFRSGAGIDLVSLNASTTLSFADIKSTDVTVIQDGSHLIIRANANDALVIRDSGDAAHLPASMTFADGVTWTAADLLAHMTTGTDAAIEAALPGLEYVLANAPTLATASTIAVGTDLVAGDGFGSGTLAEQVANVEAGAVYRLAFSLADLPTGDDGVRVMWGGQVLYEGTPGSAASDFHFNVVGGAGDGSNQLVFESTSGSTFGALLDDVHFVKLADAGVPVPDNAAPTAVAGSAVVSQDIPITGKLTATDGNSDPLVFSLGTGPEHGSVTIKADGTYQYTAAAGYTGADGFTFLVSDGHGGVDEAAMDLSVMPGVVVGTDLIVNGSFEDTSGTLTNRPWGWYSPTGTLAGWQDRDHGVRAEIHYDTQNGVNAKDGTYYFDLDGYATNNDLVQKIAHVETGATYRLTFSIADADGTTPDDGVRVLWGGQGVYEGIPPANWTTLSFNVVGGSGNGSNELEFVGTESNLNTYGAALDDIHFVKVADAGDPLPGNHAPEAVDGSAGGSQNSVIIGKLTATDVDGDVPLTFSLKDAASHGAVVIDADGTYRYTPTAGYSGVDTFTFTVSDGHGGTATAAQHLTIDPPVAVGTDLVANGGFEDVTGMSPAPGGWGWLSTTGVPGWQDLADTGGIRSEVHTNVQNGVGPKEGTKYFDLDGNGNNAILTQKIAHVETGATYKLTFSIADADGATTDDGIKVLWNGKVIYNGVPDSTWSTLSFNVTGGSGDGSNTLQFVGTEANLNWYGAALDDVHFVKVAEAQSSLNLIVNGGFEDLTGASDSATWGFRNTNPAGVFAGWTNTTDTRAEVHKDTVGGVKAAEGTYWFDMEGNPKNATLVQTVAGIEQGATYRLKFSIADTDTAQTNDSIKVYWGNQVIYSGTPLAAWQEMTIDVVGGAGDGSNKLMFASTTPSANGAGVALDNVSMVKIDGNPNLIVNGSFEDLTGANNGSATSSDWGFRNDNGVIPGWNQINTAAGGRAEIHHDTQNGVSALDGNYWFDLDGNKNNAKLVQAVSGVQTGKTYELRFSIADGDATTADDGVKVYWGGQLIYTGLPTNTWQEIILHVVGGAGDGSNKLEFDGNETNLNGYGAALDNVSMRLVDTAPVAAADVLPAVNAGSQPFLISFAALLGNDTDVDLDPLTITAIASAVGGTAVLQQDGILFTPAGGFAGPASFQYTVSDGQGGTSTAGASFTVNSDTAAGQFQTTPISVAGTTHISVEGTLAAIDPAARAIDAANAMASGTDLKVDVSASGQIVSGDDAIRVSKDLANSHIAIDNAGSITSLTGQAIDLAGVVSASTTITITNEASGQITAANADAIRPGANAVINNYGQIIASTQAESKNDAIDFQDNGAGSVNNDGDGVISGARHGITGTHGITVANAVGATIIGNSGSAVNIDNGENGETVSIVNHGSMIGAAQQGYADSDGDAIDTDGVLHLDNDGEVRGLGAFGYHDGVANVSEGVAAGGGVINNYAGGAIYGYGRAIQINDSNNGPALAATTIYNEGLIQGDGHGPAGVDVGDAAAIQAEIDGREAIDIIGSFDDTITNKGRIVGGIFTDGGNDTLANSGTIAGKVDLGDGNDTVTLSAGSHVTGTIVLGAGDDTLDASASTSTVTTDDVTVANAVTVDGGAGDDRITGSSGNDVIHGGTGNDTLGGGDGSDTYTYVANDGVDTITEAAGQSGDADSLVFTDLADGSITLYKHGDDLDIVTADGGKITVAAQFAGVAGDGIESIVFAGGVTFDHDAIAAHLTDRGPIAADVTLPTVTEDAPSFLVSFDTLLAGSSDADLDALSIGAIGDVIGGTAVITADGVLFTLAGDYNGAASFSFTVDDGRGGTAVAHASFDVTPVNDAPVVVDDAAHVQQHDTATFDLVGNDSDVEDGQPHLAGFTVNGVDGIDVSPEAAAAAFQIVDGRLQFTGDDIFGALNDGGHATVSLSYTAEDSDGGRTTGQFVLTIDGPDLHPVTGSSGSDTLTDTAAADHIVAGDGNDAIYSALGDDVIDAGTGNDTVVTLTGDKVVNGGDGNDTIYGKTGDSTLNGDDGNDIIVGGTGNEIINGGAGNDTLTGGAGNDVVNGGDGNDAVYGGAGNGVLNGNTGNDTVIGGAGNETINGGAGNDMLMGNAGNDVIAGDAGNDQIFGGLGSDIIVFKAGDGLDTVFDFQAQGSDHDVIELDHNVFADYQALMDSGAVHDTAGGVQISYADGSMLTLTGVSQSSLKVDDFHFV